LINSRHSLSKQQRQEKRQQYHETLLGENLEIALTQLETESRQQGIEGKYFKRRQNEVLQPLQQIITTSDTRIRELKQKRKEISSVLQTQKVWTLHIASLILMDNLYLYNNYY
jgi:tRNA pseudouridine32 synthase/23S rRNA pseudouridine746 synthase